MTDYPQGWYASPNVPGHDQWWNGQSWTKMTQVSNPAAVAGPTPPAGAPLVAVASATMPVAIIGVVFGIVSILYNPVFVFSLIAIILGLAAALGVRTTTQPAMKLIVALVGTAAVITGAVGALITLFSLLA